METSGNDWVALDVLVLGASVHAHAGVEHLLTILGRHPAVRSLGGLVVPEPGDYWGIASDSCKPEDIWAGFVHRVEGIVREGRANTIFVFPFRVSLEKFFDDLIPKIREQYPTVVFVIVGRKPIASDLPQRHARYGDYWYLDPADIFAFDKAKGQQRIDELLRRCESWHRTRFEYDVALSFAGEDRQHADAIAEMMTRKGLRIFYDSNEVSELLGRDLYEHLYDIYCQRARYCLMLISPAYKNKLWTIHERKAAQERSLLQRGSEYIIPVVIEDCRIPGLPRTLGFMRIDQGIDNIACAIYHKIFNDPTKPKHYVGTSLYQGDG